MNPGSGTVRVTGIFCGEFNAPGVVAVILTVPVCAPTPAATELTDTYRVPGVVPDDRSKVQPGIPLGHLGRPRNRTDAAISNRQMRCCGPGLPQATLKLREVGDYGERWGGGNARSVQVGQHHHRPVGAGRLGTIGSGKLDETRVLPQLRINAESIAAQDDDLITTITVHIARPHLPPGVNTRLQRNFDIGKWDIRRD